MVQRDCQQYYPASPLFFVCFITIARTVFLNLYLAVILDKLYSAVFQQKPIFDSDFVRYRKVRNNGPCCLRCVCHGWLHHRCRRSGTSSIRKQAD